MGPPERRRRTQAARRAADAPAEDYQGPGLHPCLRVWGYCKFGAACAFAHLDRALCLYCLRREHHIHCNGRVPNAQEWRMVATRDLGVWKRLSDHVKHKEETARNMREFYNNPPIDDGSPIPSTWRRVPPPKPVPLPTPPVHPRKLRFPPLPTAADSEEEEAGEAEGEVGEQGWHNNNGQENWGTQQDPYASPYCLEGYHPTPYDPMMPNNDTHSTSNSTMPCHGGLFIPPPQQQQQQQQQQPPSHHHQHNTYHHNYDPITQAASFGGEAAQAPAPEAEANHPDMGDMALQAITAPPVDLAIQSGALGVLGPQAALSGMGGPPLMAFTLDQSQAQAQAQAASPPLPLPTTTTPPLPLPTAPLPTAPPQSTSTIISSSSSSSSTPALPMRSMGPSTPLQLEDLMQDYPDTPTILRGSGALRFSNGDDDN